MARGLRPGSVILCDTNKGHARRRQGVPGSGGVWGTEDKRQPLGGSGLEEIVRTFWGRARE